MNIHHLELFYYVAKHEGITPALRHLPYGIQQPALSSQLIALEESLGTRLFQRRPFALTPAGRELFAFISPFFAGLRAMADKVSGFENPRLRLASTPTVIRDYFPFFLSKVRDRFPNLQLSVREVDPLQIDDLLRRQEVDIAVAFNDAKPPAGLTYRRLAKLPLALVLPKDAAEAPALETIRRALDRGTSLVALPATSAPTRAFLKGLKRHQLAWTPEIEVNSLELIDSYVAANFGLGLSLDVPNRVVPPEVRVLPLRRFPQLEIGFFWLGKLDPVAAHFAELVRLHVDKLMKTAKT